MKNVFAGVGFIVLAFMFGWSGAWVHCNLCSDCCSKVCPSVITKVVPCECCDCETCMCGPKKNCCDKVSP